MKLLKVLNKDLKSPYQNFQFKIGKKYHCEDFDESEQDCASGFYATDIDGLPYAYNIHRKVFECEVWGKSREFDIYKRRYENMKLIREVTRKELVKLAKPRDLILGYKLSEVINPINPLLIKRGKVTDKEIELLKQWASVWDSVRDSVRASVRVSIWASIWDSIWASIWASVRDSVWVSVWDSIWYSVRDSVGASIGTSVRASVGAYISSLFPNIKKWEYIDYEKGINPFQPAIDLWKAGLVPSYANGIWRLHSGKDARIVYEERRNK